MKKILSVVLMAFAVGTIISLTACYDRFAAEDELPTPPKIDYTAPEREYTIPAGGGSIAAIEGEQGAEFKDGNLIVGNFFQGHDDWSYEGNSGYYQIHKDHTYKITFTGTTTVDIPLLTIAVKATNETFDAVDWENKQTINVADGKKTLTWTVTSNANSIANAQDAAGHNGIAIRVEKPSGDAAVALGVDVTLKGIISVEEQ
ncbi:MAG: hypothetical protein LBI40_00310 [Treponema sp.]|nr:hypothetical protein [Treponema sp.]